MKKLLSLFLALALWAGLGIPASAAGFSDVPADSPFAPAIAWAVEQGITKGTTPTTFGPGNTCTTSHILTFLWRAAGRPGDAGNERAAVSAWASGLGIGVSDLSAPCTRAAAVTDLWKAQGSPAAGTAAFFSDVDPAGPYAGAVSWAVEAGVTKGTGGGAFSPENVCTRGQIVTFLYRAMADKGTAEVPKEVEKPAQGGSGTLSNGKDITEENVLAIIQEMLKKYPDGMTWNGSTFRNGKASTTLNQIAEYYTRAGTGGSTTSMQAGCGGFASLVSDSIFGSENANPARKVPVEQVRPGDVIIILNADGKLTHVATAASRITGIDKYGDKTSPILTIYDGNAGNAIRYDTYYPVPKTYSTYNGYYVEVWTRYPTDNATPWTGSSSNTETSVTPSSPDSGSGSSPSTETTVNWVTTNNPCDICGKVGGRQVASASGLRHACETCWNDPSGAAQWLISLG